MKIKMLEKKIEDRKITVKLKSDTGVYTGIAICHPDDEFNETAGFNLAATRAYIKIIHAYSIYWKTKAKGIREYFNLMKDLKEYDKKNRFVRKCYRMLKEYEDTAKFYTEYEHLLYMNQFDCEVSLGETE